MITQIVPGAVTSNSSSRLKRYSELDEHSVIVATSVGPGAAAQIGG